MKFIRSIIPIILILIICFISYNTYQNAKSVSNNPLSVIPNHSALILKINKPNKLSSYFYNKKIWNKISDVFNSKKLNTQLSLIEKLYSKTNFKNSNSLFITLLKDGVSDNGFLLSSELEEEDFIKFKNYFNVSNQNNFQYDNTDVYHIKNDSLDLYLTNIIKLHA